jgi:hypothetical protein
MSLLWLETPATMITTKAAARTTIDQQQRGRERPRNAVTGHCRHQRAGHSSHHRRGDYREHVRLREGHQTSPTSSSVTPTSSHEVSPGRGASPAW